MSILSALASSSQPLTYVEDVFSTYVYSGNGGTNVINNGINLSMYGGLVWGKDRANAYHNVLTDTVRGVGHELYSDSTAASSATGDITNFNSNGYTLGYNTEYQNVTGTNNDVSWTFRKARRFFDIVTWSGDGTLNRVIPHGLGISPGMVIIKVTNNTSHWNVWNVGMGATSNMCTLETTSAMLSPNYIASVSASSITVAPTSATNVNDVGNSFVAYLFAHDTSPNGLVQCGSFTTDSSGNASVSLGWEPQLIDFKNISSAEDWYRQDTSRGLSLTSYGVLCQNSSASESPFTWTNTGAWPTATGFQCKNLAASGTYIYMAIRRPNKPPTSGTQVFSACAHTGSGTATPVTGTGISPDLLISSNRTTQAGTYYAQFDDRLRGAGYSLFPSQTVAEAGNSAGVTSFNSDGYSAGVDTAYGDVNYSAQPYINWLFKRAPRFFDEVCYTGTGLQDTKPHNLGVVPELVITKTRSVADDWPVYHSQLPLVNFVFLNRTDAATTTLPQIWSTPTASNLVVGSSPTSRWNNESGSTYVAYLFATCPGVSKVGSYTGNGTNQNINCGFSSGARFLLVKRTDAAGDWFVFDTTRGLGSGSDPHLSLNSIAAEVTTDDSVATYSAGFNIIQNSTTNLNVNGATYIFFSVS